MMFWSSLDSDLRPGVAVLRCQQLIPDVHQSVACRYMDWTISTIKYGTYILNKIYS